MTNEELTEKIEFGEECGLCFAGEVDKDGLPIFVGENLAWDLYNKGGK